MVNLFTKKVIPLEVCAKEKFPKSFNRELGDDMDVKIWPLVRVLNLKGFPTMSSCEGCYVTSGKIYKFPWVNLDSDIPHEQIGTLEETLKKYNSEHQIKWRVFFDSKCFPTCYKLRPITYASIDTLQATISTIAKCIEDRL